MAVFRGKTAEIEPKKLIMMKIEFLIDDSEALSATEPMGIVLFQNETDELRGEYTYLDAWLICLIKGLDEIRDSQDGSMVVEFVDQLEPMVFTKKEDHVSATYFDVGLELGKQSEFEAALKKSISNLIKQFSVLSDFSENTFFDVLQGYCE